MGAFDEQALSEKALSEKAPDDSPPLRLDIRGVSKRFGSLLAVDDLHLAIPPGCIHAFLGPNGAGKTTTIRMCTGLLRPDSGSILIDGLDIEHEGVAARRRIAYVPDEPYLYERLTGREFLSFTGRIYGLDNDTYQQRLAEVSQRFHLHGFLDALAEGYSHGMRQRVVLAAALLHQPRLLIVDEPLVGLDPKHIRVVLDVLREIAAAGGSVLMSTHTLAVVEELAHSVTLIDHGRQRFHGSVAELTDQGRLEDVFLRMTLDHDEGAETP
ncbi:MAG: ABC transporter ATP-binding protein [Planctomycetota bacterium]|nr:MAG: ABC transporter ATP-binding protein [Planctomycetota bacterium]